VTLATKGIAHNVRGTMAAVVPMAVHMTQRVTGTMRIIKMMKGTERAISTIHPRMVWTVFLGNRPSLCVKMRRTPRGSPIKYEMTRDTNDI